MDFPKRLGERGEDSPVLLLQLLHQWIVDLGVHRREKTLFGDRAIEDLFDGCFDARTLATLLFQKRGRVGAGGLQEHCLRSRAVKGEASDGNAPSPLENHRIAGRDFGERGELANSAWYAD